MIEPTETESKETLDAFAEALFRITEEPADLLHEAPHDHADQPARRSPGGAAADPVVARPDRDARDARLPGDAVECRAGRQAGRRRRGTWRWTKCCGGRPPAARLLEPAAVPMEIGPRCRSVIFNRTSGASHAASADCPLVRRLSGGGAIVHDRELTYCLAVLASNIRWRPMPWLYAPCTARWSKPWRGWKSTAK